MSKFLILIFCLLISGTAKTQAFAGIPSFTAITVANIDSSVLWYSRIFNLKLRNRTDNNERGFKQAVLTGENLMIELVELRKGISPDSLLQGEFKGRSIHGFYKFGFTVPDLDKWHRQLSVLNVSFYGKIVKDPVNGRRTFLINDPDNNRIQFFEK